MANRGISETAFASQVEDLLEIYHWRWCHFRPARTQKGWRTALTGHKGLPDYIAVRPPRLLFAELKDEVKPTSPEQEGWLDDLRECIRWITLEPIPVVGKLVKKLIRNNQIPSFEVYLWRPSQFDEVEEALK